MIKLPRAIGGCLGAESRRRAWRTTILGSLWDLARTAWGNSGGLGRDLWVDGFGCLRASGVHLTSVMLIYLFREVETYLSLERDLRCDPHGLCLGFPGKRCTGICFLVLKPAALLFSFSIFSIRCLFSVPAWFLSRLLLQPLGAVAFAVLGY
jgi:hypothetical protein